MAAATPGVLPKRTSGRTESELKWEAFRAAPNLYSRGDYISGFTLLDEYIAQWVSPRKTAAQPSAAPTPGIDLAFGFLEAFDVSLHEFGIEGAARSVLHERPARVRASLPVGAPSSRKPIRLRVPWAPRTGR